MLVSLLPLGLSIAALVHGEPLPDLYVENAPSHPRPYVVPHYADSHAVAIGSQIYRFTVTGPSSDYAFTLMSTSAPGSSSLGVLPHIHQRHYENFYNLKGRFQLWAEKGESGQQARLLTQGDYGSVPRNTTHTFQILDPDTEMIGAIVPGGFEELFYALGTNFSSTTNTPYVPSSSNASSTGGGGGNDPSVISSLERFDVYAQLDFNPRRDLVNGSAPASTGWHTESNSLGATGSPYFVANNYGPKYLNSQHGFYQIVQPLVAPAQAQEMNFTMSTITVSRRRHGETSPLYRRHASCAFEVVEGLLMLQIGEYPVAMLTTGDVAFIPTDVAYQYWSDVAFTKILYVSSGEQGLDQTLMSEGRPWSYPTFPRH
ncbi:quercetin 2,3-dioxygenase [Aspergillus egyptiacus]|nr:quercetin 2,3-dioxygenase [Aspergillus egyptiacus]